MSHAQPHGGWGKRGIWHTGKCHLSTKWLAYVCHVVVFNTKVLYFKIENTPIKDTNGKRKFKRMLRVLFVDKRELFATRNSILFSSRQIRALGLFWTNRGSEVSEETWGTSCILYGQVKYVFEREFLYCKFCKGFMDVFYIFTSAWKKTTKCAFEIDFLPCAQPI